MRRWRREFFLKRAYLNGAYFVTVVGARVKAYLYKNALGAQRNRKQRFIYADQQLKISALVPRSKLTKEFYTL
jgi:hypothetical protein